MWFNIILGFHLALCIALIALVLLQQGKGADAGAALGGGSNTVFGATGANSLMVKVTTGVAVLFMITSLFLVRGYSSLLDVTVDSSPKIKIQDPGLAPSTQEASPETSTPKSEEANKAAAPAEAGK